VSHLVGVNVLMAAKDFAYFFAFCMCVFMRACMCMRVFVHACEHMCVRVCMCVSVCV